MNLLKWLRGERVSEGLSKDAASEADQKLADTAARVRRLQSIADVVTIRVKPKG